MMHEIKIDEKNLLLYWFDEDYEGKTRKKSLKREVERKEVRQKLKEKFGEKVELLREDSGQPILKNAPFQHLSISHSNGWYALFLTDNCAGVDIQTFKENIAQGKHYFVNATEEREIKPTLKNYHLLWSAKEAIYKKYKGNFSDLKNNVTILRIDDSIEVKVNEINKIEKCNYQITSQWVLVWSIT